MNITNVSAGSGPAVPQVPSETKGGELAQVSPEKTPESAPLAPAETPIETPAATVEIGDKQPEVKDSKPAGEPAASVEIGKNQTAVKDAKSAGDPAVTLQIGKQSPKIDARQTADAAKVDTTAAENVFQSVLEEVGKAIETRSAVLKSLPPTIREMAKEILSNSLADMSTFSEGLIATIKAEKSAVDQLQTFTSTLSDAQQLTKELPKKMLKTLPDLMKNFDADFAKLMKDGNMPSQPAKSVAETMPVKQTAQAAEVSEQVSIEAQTGKTNAQSLPPEVSKAGSEVKTPLKLAPQFQTSTNTQVDEPQIQTNVKVNVTEVFSDVQTPQNETAPTSQSVPVNQSHPQKQNTNMQMPQTENSAELAVDMPQPQAAKVQPKAPDMSTIPGNQPSAMPKEQEQAVKAQFTSTEEQAEQKATSLANGRFATNDPVVKTSDSPLLKQAAYGRQPQFDTPLQDGAISKLVLESPENAVINMSKQLMGNTPDSAVKNAVKQFIEQSPLNKDASPEAAVLKNLVETYAKDAPEMLKFAAAKNNLPELPQLWALVKLNKALEWTKLEQEKFQETIRSLREMTASMKKSIAFTGEKADNASSLSFSMPLYLGEGMQPYPAYIHVYHQREWDAREGAGEYKYETWLRICLQTENIGPVDMVFRLYQENLLNVKVAFREKDAAQGFSNYLPDIREALDESSLNLVEVSVNAKPDLGG